MTPLNPQARGSGTFSSGLTLGLSISGVVLVLGAALGLFIVKRAATNARAGWNLVPVVVAAVDLRAGDVLTMEMISQRSVPEQFVTSNVVLPSAAVGAVGLKIRFPSSAGDPLLWSAVKPGDDELAQVAVLKRGLEAGAALQAEDLEVRALPVQCLSGDVVLDSAHDALINQTVKVPFAAGEVLLRSHF